VLRVRGSSFEEFIRWYLARERWKQKQEPDLSGLSLSLLHAEMRRLHPDKLRSWFARARWSIVSLEAIGEAMSLVLLDDNEVRRNRLVSGAGPDNRLARAVVAAAHDTGYFDNQEVTSRNAVEGHYRQERIEAYRRSWPLLSGGERLAICDLNADEKAVNPGGTYYLHDGFGRLLPYLYAIIYEGRDYCPIEAFLAEENRG
jgi:hypothetical protein